VARDWLALYIEEDVGPGDITSRALFDKEKGRARIVAREPAVVAGVAHAREVFRRLGADAEVTVADGIRVEAGTPVLEASGPAAAILSGERLALNILSRMSGIATLTRELNERLATACCAAVVAGTRKTTPGFRAFEKEAIRIGGGDPHRMGLYDEAMVKDNHIAAAGGDVGKAVRRVKAANPGKKATCEVESPDAAMAAARAEADWLLIDNQAPDVGRKWAEAVWREFPNVKIEASGGIRPDNVVEYGWADRISLGWLTQKAQGKDFSMEWLP
jgi:nicotinate-nucleotide pyrophosphorylase (carboxylating)